MLVGASCTAELIQDDPGGLARALGLAIPVVALELPGLPEEGELGRRRDLLPARPHLRRPARAGTGATARAARCNILGPTAARLPPPRRRARDHRAARPAWASTVNVTAPLGATPADLARLGDAAFNVVLYPEIAGQAAAWLERSFGQPATTTVPIGVGATDDFIAEVAALAGLPARRPERRPRLPWYSRSVDSNYLTGKRVFIFGDATHAIAAARVAAEEFGFTVVGLGTYSREFAREVRAAATALRRRSPDHRRLPRGRGADRRRCSPNSCSAPRWSATSPSASASPAPSSRPRSTSRTSRPATRRRWASRAPTSCSTPGCTR